jgi:hypothetical protein
MTPPDPLVAATVELPYPEEAPARGDSATPTGVCASVP